MPDEPIRKNVSHHDVFISYAQQDKPVADAVCARLESRNIRCWIAPRDISPGKNFPEAIIEGIEDGKVVVLIFSSHANKSPHVTRELTNAVNKGRIIIPFRVEDVTPSKSMEYLISVPHWLDAVTPPMEKHIDRLVETVESIINPDQKPAPPPPAGDPETSPDHHRERESRAGVFLSAGKKILAITGVILAVALLVFIGIQTGFPHLAGNGTPGQISPAPMSSVDYRGSDAAVNTVVLTTEPTQTMVRDTELYVDASKDDSNAMVVVVFNGGPGMGLVKDNAVILTRSDGTTAEDKLNFNQRLSEVRLQGTRGTDRIRVQVTLYSGEVKTIVDKLLPYRTYR